MWCGANQRLPPMVRSDSREGKGSTSVIIHPRIPGSERTPAMPWGGKVSCFENAISQRDGNQRDRQSSPESVSKVGSSTPLSAPVRSSLTPWSPQPSVIGLPAQRPKRVLVAEDNRDLQNVFARQLTLLGLEVVGVANGRDAVELTLAALAAGHSFDLVLMDLEMPILDGYEAIRQLRDGGFSRPILALSAHSSDDHRLDCITLGCDDCLCKPFDWSQLARLIGEYLPGISGERTDSGSR